MIALLVFFEVKVRNAFRYFPLPNHWALFLVEVITSHLLETIRNSLNEFINADLLKISKWFKTNKLTVNPYKSNIIIITPKLNKPPVTFEIYLNSTLISQTTTANYLGIIINCN